MRLVHKKPVNAQLLKGNHIVLALIGAQFFQLGFQRFPGLFHLFDTEILTCMGFQFVDGGKRFINLLLNDALLPFKGQRDALKLRMADDDGIVVAGGDAGAEFFAVGGLKVLAPCHQQLGIRVEVQKLRSPLLRQVIGHNKQRFLAQPQPFCFHSGCRHFVGLASPHFVCKQRITAIKHMSNGVALVFPEGDLRVHAHEFDVTSIVFTGASRVKQLVILFYQSNAPLWVLPDPVGKSVLNDLLFLLRQHGLPLVQHTLGLALGILDGVIDADILQVQGLLQNLIGIGTGCAVGFGRDNIAPPGGGLALHTPLCGIGRIPHLDCMAQIVGDLERLSHKLLDNVRVQPSSTQPYINFRCFQFSGLCLNQRIHIDRKFRVGLGGKLRHPQLIAYITRKVFVRSLPARFRVGGVSGGVLEDHTGQFCGDAPILAGRAQQFCHIGQIHFAMLTNRYCQRFAGGVHAGDGALRANGALGEHRRLALELPLLVQIFQRTQQIIRGILLKQPPVFAVVQQTVLCGKGIVGGVQTLLRCLDVLVREVVQLLFDQVVDDLPQLYHAGDTAFGGVGQFYLRHHGIFPVEHFAVHHRVGEILHLRVGRQSTPGGFFFGNVGSVHLGGGVLPLDVLHRFGKLVGKADALKGRNRQFLSSVLGAFGGQFAQHHLWVVCEILVDGKAILGFAQLNPVRLMVDGAVTLLQKDNIRNDFRSGICLERIVGQANCAEQISTFGNMLAGSAVPAVHRVAAGDKSYDTTWTQLVDGFGKEIVVDAEAQFVICLVCNFIIAKRDVAHCKVIEIPAVGGFKTCYRDVSLRVQLLRNASGDAVQFHTIQAAVLHGVRQHPEKVADTHAGFQNIAATESHFFYCIIDGTDNGGAGIVCIQHRPTGGGVLVLRKHSFQFGVLLCPVVFVGVKGICQTAPADILRQHFLLLGRSTTMLLL